MDSRKLILRETAVVAVGEALCTAVMLGVFALLGRFDRSVLLGGVFGWLFAVMNVFFMALGAMMAADKAEKQDVKGGQTLIRLSFLLRMAVLFLLMFALVKGGVCNVISLVVPLLFTRPILTIAEYFRKAGDPKE